MGKNTLKERNAPAAGTLPLMRVESLYKVYPSPMGDFTALSNVSFLAAQGEFIAVVGRSGSGKSTLMNLLTGIDAPSTGHVVIGGTDIHALSQNDLSLWRGRNIGVVFQVFQLLPTLTVLENIMLPMDFCRTYPVRERSERALALLSRVGIRDQAGKLPASLSGGQQQRAAIARALANDPMIIAADEPTGNLDSHTADAVLDLFSELSADGKTVIMVTHERAIGHRISREIRLMDGAIVSDAEAEERHA